MVERRVRKRGADSIGERQRRRSVHDRMFAHEPCSRTVEHDHLYRLVHPAVAQAVRGAMPEEARCRQKVAWGRRVEAEHERGRVNRVEQRGIRRREGAQMHVVGRPEVSVRSG